MDIVKIVITGGPCAGKSTAMSKIQKEFIKMGYLVLFIAETATELITGGITPINDPDFQSHLLNLQIEKEATYIQAAKSIGAEKVLIVCDRGVIDNKAYMTDEQFESILYKTPYSEIEVRDSYDAVFHLVTAAKGAVEFYTTENNAARTETPEQAAELDDKIISAWTGHSHFRIIDNIGSFEDKINRLISEISSFLGEPEPLEIERKFLIKYPNIEWLESLPNCQRVEIIQTYLNSSSDEEVRVRQRGLNGIYSYYKTTKKNISSLKRIEIEKRLSSDEYLELLMNADTSRRQIRKTRYCLTYKNNYLELDIYPFWNDKAILEIELSNENDSIDIPDEIKIIKEVTDDDSYKNANLAIERADA